MQLGKGVSQHKIVQKKQDRERGNMSIPPSKQNDDLHLFGSSSFRGGKIKRKIDHQNP
jgi:hypothetical protein